MSTSTIDESAATEVVSNPDLESEINTIVEQEAKTKTNREDLSYYYSSGNFNFIFEHGFKPETLETIELTKVPFLPDWYDGIISIHGLIIVFKLESIPQLVNMTQLEEVETDDNSPEWINNYLQNDSIKLAFVDHNKLFDELITKQ